MKKILIIGATSAIAQAVARRFAQSGATLFLLARDKQRLDAMAADLKLRGAAAVHTGAFEALEYVQHQPVLEAAIGQLGGLDAALIAYGNLPDQAACQQSFDVLREQFEVNALSVMSLLTHLANHCEQAGGGSIAVIGSVAGDRGRQSNYAYGAAKGALAVFLQGLRNRLHRYGVHVLTIKPGFVDTPMTAEFPKGLLWSQPEQIAKRIEQALRRRADVVYTPGYWALIMMLIKHIPERWFKRLFL